LRYKPDWRYGGCRDKDVTVFRDVSAASPDSDPSWRAKDRPALSDSNSNTIAGKYIKVVYG